MWLKIIQIFIIHAILGQNKITSIQISLWIHIHRCRRRSFPRRFFSVALWDADTIWKCDFIRKWIWFHRKHLGALTSHCVWICILADIHRKCIDSHRCAVFCADSNCTCEKISSNKFRKPSLSSPFSFRRDWQMSNCEWMKNIFKSLKQYSISRTPLVYLNRCPLTSFLAAVLASFTCCSRCRLQMNVHFDAAN